MTGDLTALLQLELETLWMTDDRGRIERCRADGVPFEPLLVVAAGRSGRCWAASVHVPTECDAAIAEALVNAQPALAVGWAPECAAELLRIIDAVPTLGPLARPLGGPSWLMEAPVDRAPTTVELHRSVDFDAESWRERIPGRDRELTEPWVMAVVDDQVAAICETARSAPKSVEAGVWTYEPYRGRGLAVAVTAEWSSLVSARTVFYSTSWDNVASQGVARRLGLEPLGHWWQICRREY